MKNLLAAAVILVSATGELRANSQNAPTRWTLKSQLEQAELVRLRCLGKTRGIRGYIRAQILVFEKQGYEFSSYTNGGLGLEAAKWSCKAAFDNTARSCRNDRTQTALSQFSTVRGENVLLNITENEDGCLEVSKGDWSPEVELDEAPFQG